MGRVAPFKQHKNLKNPEGDIMISLYNKFRPKTFDEVIGQPSIVKILENQIKTGNIKNAYGFIGFSGTGKTTVARAFANALNQGKGQPIEIDAASNSGVENIRDIRKEAQERAIDGKYKIYIIDEVHMLSLAAFAALLKIIEEPPEYTIFILCTTDAQKIPATIMNRIQTFNFNKIPTSEIVDRLNYVCEQEGFTNYTETIEYIGKLCNGCMREALTLLEKCADYSTDLSMENALEVLGYQSYDSMFALTNSVLDGDEKSVLKLINKIYDEGKELKLFVDQYINFILDIDKYALFKSCELIKIPRNREQDIINLINFENPTKYYNYVLDKLLELKNTLKNDTDTKATIEIMFLQITRMQ